MIETSMMEQNKLELLRAMQLGEDDAARKNARTPFSGRHALQEIDFLMRRVSLRQGRRV